MTENTEQKEEIKKETELQPQEEALLSLKNSIGNYISRNVTVDLDTGEICLKLHTGRPMREGGARGCSISEIIKVALFMQLYYDEKFQRPDSPGPSQGRIAEYLTKALEMRQDFEVRGLARMYFKNPYGFSK